MRLFQKRYIWAVLYGLLLTGFTAYTLLDTFVITRVYTVVEEDASADGMLSRGDNVNGSASAEDTDDSTTASNAAVANPASDGTSAEERGGVDLPFTDTVISTDTTYSDEHISITITEYREYDTSIYVAEVYLSSAEYLQTALAENACGRNITAKTSEIASENGAILAINGDYYGSQTRGYVLRNGVLYRESASSDQEDLVIWQDGSFEIVTEGEVSAAALLNAGAEQILSFGPALMVDGAVSVDESDEVGKSKASNPRTAIGIIDELHYVLVVSDGRTDESAGLSLYELAEFLDGLGVQTAYNLDGGGSSTMYFNGEIVNNPTTSGNSIKERSVSDIVYIGY